MLLYPSLSVMNRDCYCTYFKNSAFGFCQVMLALMNSHSNNNEDNHPIIFLLPFKS